MVNKLKQQINNKITAITNWLKDKTKYNQHLLAFGVIIIFSLVVIFTWTNPNTVGPVGILTTLLLVYSLAVTIILSIRVRAAGKFTTRDHKKLLIFRSALDATPIVVLVGLNTLKQLTWSDLVIVPLFYLLFRFYVHRQYDL